MKTERTWVVITSSFPIRNDGSEAAGSFVADMVMELATHVRVRVVAPGPQATRELLGDRIEVFRYAAPFVPLSTLKPWRIKDLRWIVRVLRGGLAATRSAVADDAEHIFALWGLPCGEWARRVARARNIGYSVWMLGSDVWSLGRIPVLRWMLSRVMRRAARAYADGYQLASDARRISGVPVEFLPSTRNVMSNRSQERRTESPYRLLFLGRWHPNKGIDLLLEALSLLGDDDWRQIDCVEIQGGGPLESLVRERIAELRRQGRPVELGGFLAKAQAEAAIAQADWLLIPSRIESIPVVFSDAMKLGCPVIATPVGDLPRLVSGTGVGICAEAVSAGALVKAIRTALSDREAINRVASLSNMSEKFDLATLIVPEILAAVASDLREGKKHV
jgi:glycosyltransferase involved in cell wall biosynthesis